MSGLDAMTPFEAALVNRLCAERDLAQADLAEARAALGRVEALCDEADRRPWNGTVPAFRAVYVDDLRAALGDRKGETT